MKRKSPNNLLKGTQSTHYVSQWVFHKVLHVIKNTLQALIITSHQADMTI
jgi:hypothetical protein